MSTLSRSTSRPISVLDSQHPDHKEFFAANNVVTVFACLPGEITDCTWDVYWRIGLRHQGVCRCQCDEHLGLGFPSQRIVAELLTMQWLLEECDAVGNNPNLDRTVLVFSTPEVQSIMDGTSKKSGLSPYTFYLQTRFAGASIQIYTRTDWVKPHAKKKMHRLWIDGPVGEVLHAPGLGAVWLTRHVLAQFRMRINNVSHAQAYRELQRIVQHAKLHPLLPNNQSDTSNSHQQRQTIQQKEPTQHPPNYVSNLTLEPQKGRDREPCVLYCDENSPWVYVIGKEDGQLRLVTVYVQNGNQAQSAKHSLVQARRTSKK